MAIWDSMGFSDIINNDNAQLRSAPIPQQPQEVEQRRGQWNQLLEDPNAKSALFRMGLNLLRGNYQGESTAGAIGRTAMDAMDFYGFRNELERKRQMEQQRFGLESRQANANIARTEQATSQESAKFAEWKQGASQRQEVAQLEIDNLRRQGKTEEARAKEAEFKVAEAERKAEFIKQNPELADQAMRDELALPTAELRQTEAQTRASNASAANANASAQRTKQTAQAEQEELDAMPAWIRALPSPEAQTYAIANRDKPQSEIMAGLDRGEHFRFVKPSATSAADAGAYDALADSIITQYKARGKPGESIDTFVTNNYNVTLGKSAGAVMQRIQEKMGQGGTATPAAAEIWVKDSTGKLVRSK
jgi:hypothetical protein